jgi:hypothetical protein
LMGGGAVGVAGYRRGGSRRVLMVWRGVGVALYDAGGGGLRLMGGWFDPAGWVVAVFSVGVSRWSSWSGWWRGWWGRRCGIGWWYWCFALSVAIGCRGWAAAHVPDGCGKGFGVGSELLSDTGQEALRRAGLGLGGVEEGPSRPLTKLLPPSRWRAPQAWGWYPDPTTLSSDRTRVCRGAVLAYRAMRRPERSVVGSGPQQLTGIDLNTGSRLVVGGGLTRRVAIGRGCVERRCWRGAWILRLGLCGGGWTPSLTWTRRWWAD